MAALDADGDNIVDKGATVIATGSGMGMMGPPGGGPGGPGGPPPFGGKGGPGGPPPFGKGPGGPGGPGGPPMESGSVKQANIQITVDLQEAGTELTVKDSNGNVIITHKPEASYSKILISTPKLIEGKEYTVIAGTKTETVTASGST